MTSSTSPTSAPSNGKRKVNLAGPAFGSRPAKRRASRACHCCRSRKVRCDVIESGTPCTNCRLDEVDCVVTESKRRKKPRTAEDADQSPCSSVDESEDLLAFANCEDAGLQEISSSLDGFLTPAPLSTADFGLSIHRPHMRCLFQRPESRMANARLTSRRPKSRSSSDHGRTGTSHVFDQPSLSTLHFVTCPTCAIYQISATA